MINVLLIIKRYSGDYALVNEMARLDERRFRSVVCYLSGERDGKNSLDDRIKTYYLSLKNNEISPWNSRSRKLLADIFNNERIDVVNCHLQRTIGLTVDAARMARRPPRLLATLHGLGSADSWKRRFGNWFLYRRLDRVIGVSEGVRQDILRNNWGLKPDKVVTIHNGIDPTPFLADIPRSVARQELLPTGGEGCWFGSLGRLSEVKNQRTLLRAFARVVAVKPEVRLFLAGRGELEEELRTLANSLGLTKQVVFLGFRRDVPLVLRALDVFVLPSLREGLPLSLMEAMCSGLPAVASRVGGIPELVGDAEFAALVAPEDEPSLSEAMLAMASLSYEDRSRLGSNAQGKILSNFTAKEMTDKYSIIYAEIYESGHFG